MSTFFFFFKLMNEIDSTYLHGSLTSVQQKTFFPLCFILKSNMHTQCRIINIYLQIKHD